MIERIEIFCKYQRDFFPRENVGKKTKEFMNGYILAIQDILNLIDYERNNRDKVYE